jgi:hypothetical protein
MRFLTNIWSDLSGWTVNVETQLEKSATMKKFILTPLGCVWGRYNFACLIAESEKTMKSKYNEQVVEGNGSAKCKKLLGSRIACQWITRWVLILFSFVALLFVRPSKLNCFAIANIRSEGSTNPIEIFCWFSWLLIQKKIRISDQLTFKAQKMHSAPLQWWLCSCLKDRRNVSKCHKT